MRKLLCWMLVMMKIQVNALLLSLLSQNMAKGWGYLKLPLSCTEQNQKRQGFATPALEGSPLASFPWYPCRATQFSFG